MLGSGFTIGKIFGIRIRVDWSWIFIFLLVTWNLVTAFDQFHPGWSDGIRWGLAVLASLLFFLSVLAHELAHSLVARSYGMPVKDIVLFLFGGVSNITREPRNPKEEFLMAVAGPVTSLALGAVMLIGVRGSVLLAAQQARTTAISPVSMLTPIQTILLWLGAVNVILAAFNLIPGFPLDGGRVLRSILWGILRNLRKATRLASLVGQAIAWTMIAMGVAMAFGVNFPVVGSGLINGMWMAFVGWFLNSASAQSYQQVAMKDLLSGIQVNRLMRTDPPHVEPDCSVDYLMHQHLMNADDQAFPVLQDEHLVGIVSLDDVRRAPRDQWDTTPVSQIMTPANQLVTTTPEEDVSEAMDKLMQRDVRQLPVLDGGSNFIGLLKRRDIMRYLQAQMQT